MPENLSRAESLKHTLLSRAENGGIALAFSGGTDSSFLLALLKELKEEKSFPLKAFHMHSLLQTPEELVRAENRAEAAGIELEVFDIKPFEVPEIISNSPLRCFHCKRRIFAEIRKRADSDHLRTIIDGTNADDLRSPRPGLAALKAYQVFSPLAELGFTKAEIRRTAAEMALECAFEPSNSCLATRFESGRLLTEKLLEKTAAGERFLRQNLLKNANLRLRIRKDGLARIRTDQASAARLARRQAEIFSALRKLGFHRVEIELEILRPGNTSSSAN